MSPLMHRIKELGSTILALLRRITHLGSTILVFGSSILALLAFGLLTYLLWRSLKWYIAPTTPGATERQDLVQTLAQILGGVLAPLLGAAFVVLGFYIAHRYAQTSDRNAQVTAALAEQGQLTDRYLRAVDQLGATDEHLGNKKLEIRIGGIYALERIALDSPRDQQPITEILTSYIRENAPYAAHSAQDPFPAEDPYGIEFPRVPLDVQAILTVLRRRSYSYYIPEEYSLSLDLSDTNLPGADLQQADLQRADFRRTNLWGAYLRSANLRSANLQRADLRSAYLQEANLQEAYLQGANLQEAYLQGANLQEAYLVEADFQGAHLSGANLSEANLSGADLSEAILSGAYLSEAILITQEQLDRAIGDEYTQLPPDLKRPAQWGVKTDEQPEED
jgi:hypothetical protein